MSDVTGGYWSLIDDPQSTRFAKFGQGKVVANETFVYKGEAGSSTVDHVMGPKRESTQLQCVSRQTAFHPIP